MNLKVLNPNLEQITTTDGKTIIEKIFAKGSFSFVDKYEVEKAQFVKIHLDGARQYGQLSKAGGFCLSLLIAR